MSTILLMEDEDVLRMLVRLQLEEMGYEVIEACHGAEGLELFDKHHVDLVLTDLMMPHKNGLEAIVELKQRNPFQRIVAMSGGGGADDRLRLAESLGASHTLPKPFHYDDLVFALESAMHGDSRMALTATAA